MKRSGMFVVLHRIIRPLLWPIMAAVELLLLVAGWVCAVAHPATAARIVRLAEKMPDQKWYFQNDLAMHPPKCLGNYNNINSCERAENDCLTCPFLDGCAKTPNTKLRGDHVLKWQRKQKRAKPNAEHEPRAVVSRTPCPCSASNNEGGK